MKSVDEIAKALSMCPGDSVDCEQDMCPYWEIRLCVPELHMDAKEQIDLSKDIVICGDCKQSRMVGSGFFVCNKTNAIHYPDWYCADGEHK